MLVRLAAPGTELQGPWIALSHGEVGPLIGPFTLHLFGFKLDGRSYLQVQVGRCTNCGGVGTEVHAVESGRLRRVLESFANAN